MERVVGIVVVVWCLFASPAVVIVNAEEPSKLVQKALVPVGELTEGVTRSFAVDPEERKQGQSDTKPLTPFSSRVGEPVHIEAKIYELVPGSGILSTSEALKQVEDGSARLLASPVFASGMGFWTRHDTLHRVSLPSAYQALSIPRSLKEMVKGGDEMGQPWAVNDSGVILPAFPSDFSHKDIGLKLRFRPLVGSQDGLKVECELDQSILKGFVDIGKPVIVEKENTIGKNPKTEVLYGNDKVKPVFAEQSEKVVFEIGEDAEPVARVLFANSPGSGETALTSSSTLYQSGLRPLLVLVNAHRTEITVSPPKVKPDKGDLQMYLTFRVVEIQNETGHEDPAIFSKLQSQSIMTDPQFQMMIRALSQKKGVDLLSAPSVMLRDSQAGGVEVTREFIYPTKYDPPKAKSAAADSGEQEQGFPVSPATPVEFSVERVGLNFQILPHYLADGTIELKMRLTNSEPQGFLDFGEPIASREKNPWGKRIPVVISENRILTPVFRKRAMEMTTRIPDGTSLCLGGFVTDDIQILEDKVPILGDLPGIGQLGRKRVELNTQRKLYLFVRAQAMDPTGMPIRKKE